MIDIPEIGSEWIHKNGNHYVVLAIADDGSARYVFRFDNPPGLLHIFNENQLEIILPDFWPNFK